MALELTHQDLLTLDKQRLERFRARFDDTLSFCLLYLDRGNDLKIHCSEPWVVDLLLYEIDQLAQCAWIVVGATQISIYYAQEEIYTTETQTFASHSESSVNSQIPH